MTERTLREKIETLEIWQGDDGRTSLVSLAAVLALLDAHTAEQPAPDAVAEAPTDGQLVSACRSYNHGYGLMDPEQRGKLHFQCREWWRSIARAINDGDRP